MITLKRCYVAALIACIVRNACGFSLNGYNPVARLNSVQAIPLSNGGRSQCEHLTSLDAVTAGTQPSRSRQRDSLRNFLQNMRHNPIWRWRGIFGFMLTTIFLFRNSIDVALIDFWKYLLTSQALFPRIFRTDSWEWCLAIACFAVFIHAFGLADKLVRRADREGRVHPWKKHRLQDRYEADKHRRKLMKQQTTAPTELEHHDQEASPPLATKHSEWHWQSWVFEFWVYAAPLMVWDIVAPRRHRRIGGFGPPTTMGILGGILGGLLVYDFFFFCGHYAMHKIPFLYRFMHAKHHKIKEVRACDQVRLTLTEEVYDVLCSIVALNLLSVHPVARTLYNIVITYLLTDLHCGFDFPWQPQNVVPFGLVTGSRRHHYHHRYNKHYYQKFFCHVDRLFGFFQKDDGTLEGNSVKRDAYVPPSWAAA